MKAAFASDIGRQRESNEDSVGVFCHGGQLFGVVADGMGGHAAGEVASRMALKLSEASWQALGSALDREQAVEWLNHLVRAVNVRLYDHAEKHAECYGMGTTFAAAFCDERFVVITTVGDSRIYTWSAGAGMRQMTEDHTLVNELVKKGEITKDDACVHPDKHILMRALGTEPTVALDTLLLDWHDFTHLIICSDGLSNKLTNEQMSTTMALDQSLEQKATGMVQAANNAGGEDNISLVIISHDDGGEME
ncbi:MAG: Stp1/IreP family PP2C-type Ser/Thr phosphatase [Sporolactobacillus sp.]